LTGDNNYNEGSWSYKDALALGLVVGAHVLALWQFSRVAHPMLEIAPVPLEISLVMPPDEPPPPEPPKPPPPREQPKPPPKQVPKPTLEPPPVIVETPVAKPIEAPPPPPPTPPAPTPPAAPRATSGSYLLIKTDCKPVYPRKSLREGIEGKVTLLISVDERGIPDQIEISKSSGSFDLDNAARAAAGRCVFVPQTVNGAPVKSKGLRDIVFKLSEG
jgi:protein TonB